MLAPVVDLDASEGSTHAVAVLGSARGCDTDVSTSDELSVSNDFPVQHDMQPPSSWPCAEPGTMTDMS